MVLGLSAETEARLPCNPVFLMAWRARSGVRLLVQDDPVLARNGLRAGVELGARLRSGGDHEARRGGRPLIPLRLDLAFLGLLGGRFFLCGGAATAFFC